MKIAVGSDHGGLDLKEQVTSLLRSLDVDVIDVGCYGRESVDYPAFAAAVCHQVVTKECERGILICGTGIGMSIAANRYRDIRAALCHEAYSARMSREHNNANVLCLGGRVVGLEIALDIVRVWIKTKFAGGRHQRRLQMLA